MIQTPEGRIPDGARTSEDPARRQAWRRQFIRDEIDRIDPQDRPLNPRQANAFWLEIGQPPNLGDFRGYADRMGLTVPKGLTEIRAQYGEIKELLSICQHGDTRSFYAGRSLGQPVSPIDQYRAFKGIKELDAWANEVLARPEVQEALTHAHEARDFNEHFYVDDPFLPKQLARLETQVDQNFRAIYADPAEAKQKFEDLTVAMGFEKAIDKLTRRPGQLGRMVGTGRGIFSDEQRHRAKYWVGHALAPNLEALNEAQESHAVIESDIAKAGGLYPVDEDLLAFERAAVRLSYSINLNDRMSEAATRIRGDLDHAVEAKAAMAELAPAAAGPNADKRGVPDI
ncbi:MAG: hypothetical protein KI792_00505 [Alphaproteobacteria bacterium]|nr:hypothetical protein [Alphaproteobacteria bacterium SS10]